MPLVSDGDARTTLRLDPFRAVTYTRTDKLAELTCPPYDVIGAGAVETFEAADAHNIVHLILPRPGPHEDRYTHAARELRSWQAGGVLTRDRVPALYVYEHVNASATALGLVGAVGLTSPVLPHEDTFPGPVADRAALMDATRAQLEPILLTYEGGGAASDIVDSMVGTPPILSARIEGATHRVWRIADPERLASVAADLATRRALIADGHHRFAAYRRVMAEAARPDAESSGLAMLVDATRHPLALRGVHRSVRDLTFDDAITAARSAFQVSHVASLDEAMRLQARAADQRATFVVGDGRRYAVLHDPDGRVLEATLPPEHSPAWRSLDAAVLRHTVLGSLWRVDDAGGRVRHHHDAGTAIAAAADDGGVAVLVRSPQLGEVLGLAAAGERMPQKSTSFGPKPRMGLLMRLLEG